MPCTVLPYPRWPVFEEDEIAAVQRVLSSGKVNFWTGNECREFEREYAAHLGRRHAISLANGTVALELALRALGVGPGDDVVVPSRTFIATAAAAVLVGARPVVADVDAESGNVTADTLRAALTPATRAMIVVHLGGWPCEMAPIMELSRETDIPVVEDCAQAHGAEIDGKPVGSFGHVAAFSFCQDKIITTGGEGGLVVTDDDALFERMWSFKDHGKSLAAVARQHPPGFRWLHESFGSNYRMTEMQAAIGRIQLRKLPAWVAARQRNARAVTKALEGVPGLRVPIPSPSARNAYYRLYAYLDPAHLADGWDRGRLLSSMEAEQVPCASGSCGEIYREKAFERFGSMNAQPVARVLHESSLAFLVHPTMSEEDAVRAGVAARSVLERAVRM